LSVNKNTLIFDTEHKSIKLSIRSSIKR